MNSQQPNYAFSPSLLDGFQRMTDTTPEDFFYQGGDGKWHVNYNENEGTFHYSEEEVDALLEQEFLNTVNKVEEVPSEAASKGSCFNEILDCLILNRPCEYDGMVIKHVKSADGLHKARLSKMAVDASNKITVVPPTMDGCEHDFAMVGYDFIYAALDGFEFFFDKSFCKEAAQYFKDSVTQYYTKCNLKTSKGIVELHGYIDYLRRDKVYDAKTTKLYQFENYKKKWQRYTYPFTLIESGMMNEITSFEFTVYVLKGGTKTNPLITGTQYKEEYTYDHEQARQMLTQQCEGLIDWLENHRDKITNLKVFGNGISD